MWRSISGLLSNERIRVEGGAPWQDLKNTECTASAPHSENCINCCTPTQIQLCGAYPA